MTIPVFVPGMHIDDNGNLVIDADEAAEAGVKSIEFIEGTPESRIAELQAELKAARETIADLRDLAYNRAPKLAAEEASKQRAELEARLKEAEGEIATTARQRDEWVDWCKAAEARAEAAEEAEWLVVWGCASCGELRGAVDPAWRRNGSGWEHMCGDPQAGYFAGRIIVPAVVKGEYASLNDQLKRAIEDGIADTEEEKQRRLKAEADAGRLKEANTRMHEDIEALENVADLRRIALEQVEYHQAYTFGCPWCFSLQEDGHKPDCARQAALRPAAEQPTPRDVTGEEVNR